MFPMAFRDHAMTVLGGGNWIKIRGGNGERDWDFWLNMGEHLVEFWYSYFLFFFFNVGYSIVLVS